MAHFSPLKVVCTRLECTSFSHNSSDIITQACCYITGSKIGLALQVDRELHLAVVKLFETFFLPLFEWLIISRSDY